MDEPVDNTRILLARHRAGDKTALEILFRRYYPRVARIVRIRLGPARLARASEDDYVQDVFRRMLESIHQYEERSDAHFIDWVAQIAQHVISNHARNDRAQKRGSGLVREMSQLADSSRELDHAAETTAVPDKAAYREDKEHLDACIARLAEPHREVILLRRFTGFDWQTIAEKMGRPSPEACQELYRRAQIALGATWNEAP